MYDDDNGFIVGGILGLIFGCLIGGFASELHTAKIWQDECLKNGVGEFDKETGQFKLLKLK